MLIKTPNETYTAIHYQVEGRERHPNVAIYTNGDQQWILGLRHTVTIDAQKYPHEAEAANKALADLKGAFAALPQNQATKAAWAQLTDALKQRFQRADDDGFADNYVWYRLQGNPEEIDRLQQAGFPQ
jgi:hypothetical protein